MRARRRAPRRGGLVVKQGIVRLRHPREVARVGLEVGVEESAAGEEGLPPTPGELRAPREHGCGRAG